MQTHTRSIRRESERSMLKSEGLIRRVTTIAAGLLLAALLAVLVLLWGERPAEAAFPPGLNGSIAFVSERDSTGWDPDSRNEEIYVMNADGSHQTRLTVNQDPTWSAGRDLLPSFAPDGRRVTFTSRRAFLPERPEGGVDEIYVMDARDADQDGNGDNLQRITGDPPHNFQSVFSPDGEHIGFVRNEANPGSSILDNEIYMMNANGTNQIRLTDNTVLDSLPAFSPDGQRIAFTSMRDGNREIHVMNAAPESEDNRPVNLTKNSATDTYANFSPDGKQIVFSSDRASGEPGEPKVRNERDIWVMASDGSGTPTRLTDSPGDDYRPDWGRHTYDFSGFFRPVDNPGAGPEYVVNVVNAGRAIPVKFSLAGYQGMGVLSEKTPPYSVQIPRPTGADPDVIEAKVDENFGELSYDQSADRYTFVWKTRKDWTGQYRELVITLADGTEHTALFQFKRLRG
jgi:Tol biopolymer transport system component